MIVRGLMSVAGLAVRTNIRGLVTVAGLEYVNDKKSGSSVGGHQARKNTPWTKLGALLSSEFLRMPPLYS